MTTTVNTYRLLRGFVHHKIPARTRRNVIFRKPIQTFTSEEHAQYMKRDKIVKLKSVALPKPLVSHKVNVTDNLAKLKYKKLKDIPGNAFNKMLLNLEISTSQMNRNFCLLSGVTLITEAINCGWSISSIYFNKLQKLEGLPLGLLKKTRLTHIPDGSLKTLSRTANDGVFALVNIQDSKSRQKIIDMRSAAVRKRKTTLIPLSLICDGIEHAKDMGEILRTAVTTGCEQVYIMEDCIDIWDMEVLQAGCGAHFKIPIISHASWDRLERLNSQHNVFLCCHNRKSGDLKDIGFPIEVEKYEKSERFLKILERECSEGTLLSNSDDNVATTKLPSIYYDEANLLEPSMIVVGKISPDAFHFAARMHHQNGNSSILNFSTASEKDPPSALMHANVVTFEARRQKQYRTRNLS